MKAILDTVRKLNRMFNHHAEPVFINTTTKTIDDRHAPSLKRNRIPAETIGEWIKGNYGFVHPDYPNLLFFAVDLVGSNEVLACCGPLPPFFTCSLCMYEKEITPESLSKHEFFHSVQLMLNPNIGFYEAEKWADVFEDLEFT